MDWLHPTYWWALLAVPVAALAYGWAARRRAAAMEQFGDVALVERLAAAARPRWRAGKAALVVVALALAGVALAGPRFGTKVRTVERTGVDLVVALDVSQSMQAQDVAPNRLERAKNEIKRLLGRLDGDRVGLVLFAGDGFVQCPLTTDYNAVRLFLDVADPDLMATPGTRYPAALDAAVQAFNTASPDGDSTAAPRRTRALLVVSDGGNHSGDLEALKERARAENVRVFAGGVGETDGTTIPVFRNGRKVGVKKDRNGSVVRTRLREDVLTTLAEGGAYFRIGRTSSALSDFETALNQLEQSTYGAERFEEYAEVFQWPLALALLLLCLEPLIPERTRRTDVGAAGEAGAA
jgi:Ca-activated chloride channel family protein